MKFPRCAFVVALIVSVAAVASAQDVATAPAAGATAAAATAAGTTAAAAGVVALDVRQLRDLALQRNPGLLSARLGVDEAAGKVLAARGARRPTVSLEARTSWFANPADAVVIGAGEFGSIPTGPTSSVSLPSSDVVVVDPQDPFYYYAALGVSQPLWTWGKLDASVKLREAERSISSADALRTELSLLSSLYGDLYSLAYQRSALAVVREQESLSRRMVATIDAARAAGAATDLDYRDAALEAEKISRSAAALQDAVGALERDIRTLAGADPDAAISTDGLAFIPVLPDRGLDAWISGVGAANLDLQYASAAVSLRRAAEDLATKSAAGKPDLAANLNFGWSGSRLPGEDEWSDKGDWFLTATVGVKGNLLDFGTSAGSVAEKKAAARRAELDYGKARASISDAVSGAYSRIRTLAGDLSYQERLARFQAERVASTEKDRAAGSKGELDVLKAQAERLGAVMDLASARMRYSDACISFLSLADPSLLLDGSPFAAGAAAGTGKD